MTHSTFLASAVVPVALLVASLNFSVPAPAPESHESTSETINQVTEMLTNIAVRTPCDRECRTNCVVSLDHRSIDVGAGGSHGGSYHGCLGTQMGCDYHTCGFAWAPGELQELIDLVATLDFGELQALTQEDLGLEMNMGRRAVQVLSCGDRVAATLPFTTLQESQMQAELGA